MTTDVWRRALDTELRMARIRMNNALEINARDDMEREEVKRIHDAITRAIAEAMSAGAELAELMDGT